MAAVKLGDRRTCDGGTKSAGVCGMEIELRQGPNATLPPGWWEYSAGAWYPHTCRSWCRACQRKIGGPDRHAPGCETYERLLRARADLLTQEPRPRRTR